MRLSLLGFSKKGYNIRMGNTLYPHLYDDIMYTSRWYVEAI